MNPIIHNMSFTDAGLTGTGAETVYDTANTLTYAIDGVLKAKTAVTDGVTPTTDINTGAAFNAVLPDQACLLLWLINAAGTVAMAQGDIVDVDGDTDDLKNPAQFPIAPAGYAPFAYTLFQTDGTSSAGGLLPGTSNWNATGLTATHREIAFIPSRPILA